MKRLVNGLLLAVPMLAAGPALAIEVERLIEVEAAPDEVWALIGPFCAIQEWHPAVMNCVEEVEADATQRRRLGLQGGGEIYEEQTSRDDDARQYGYIILESPLPIEGYKSTLTVDSLGEGRSRVVWKSTFEPKGASDEEVQEVFAGFYEAGLAEIKAQLEE